LRCDLVLNDSLPVPYSCTADADAPVTDFVTDYGTVADI
jgi:hypothetical protein